VTRHDAGAAARPPLGEVLGERVEQPDGALVAVLLRARISSVRRRTCGHSSVIASDSGRGPA
jgi:hypothetical protein